MKNANLSEIYPDLNSHLSLEEIAEYKRLNAAKQKSTIVALCLAFFLGGFGAHKFYQGRYFSGSLYLIFSWTLVPFFFSFIDLFFIPKQIAWNNKEVALRSLINVSPHLAQKAQALVENRGRESAIEMVVKIFFGILFVWLVYVFAAGFWQKIEKQVNFDSQSLFHRQLKVN